MRVVFYWISLVAIALVWVLNGLVCKVLDFVPRHQEIVGIILGEAWASELTLLIGLSETALAMVILTRWQSRLVTFLQIGLVMVMNVMEFFLVSDLLLWGRLNLVFAVFFSAYLYFHEFYLKPPSV